MASKLYLIGGGGHCHSCIDVIEASKEFDIIGIIDKEEKIGDKVLNYSIIGTDNNLLEYINRDTYFLITIGQIKSSSIRENIFNKLISLKANIATVVSPFAIVSKYANIGSGTIVMHGSIVGPNVRIGNNCIINNGADIEHDSAISNHCHISTRSVINGNCKIGNGVFIGSNTTVFQGISIIDNAVVSGGSLIRKNITEEGVYVNNESIKNG